jgi:hypothetical protein
MVSTASTEETLDIEEGCRYRRRKIDITIVVFVIVTYHETNGMDPRIQ